MEKIINTKDLVFLGDIVPGGILHYKTDFVSAEIQSYLSKFEYRIATLEAAIGDNYPFDAEKMNGRKNIIYSKNADIQKMIELNINIVSLANNHIFDLGLDGFKNTISLLDKYNILYCGAGLNIVEASRPVVITSQNKTIAIFSYCMYGSKYIGHVPIATENHYGINPLDIDRAVKDIKESKHKYDIVIVMPHWGREYTYYPLVESKQIAYALIDAGADAIIGGHTHQVQPLVKYKKKPIYFSLSNFLFPDYYMQPPRPIWYPDETYNRSTLKKYHYYPTQIDEPAVLIWREICRIGMMVELSIRNIKSTSYKLSYLTSDNVVVFLDKKRSRRIRFRLKIMGFTISLNSYKMILKMYYSRLNIIRRGFHFANRLLSKK